MEYLNNFQFLFYINFSTRPFSCRNIKKKNMKLISLISGILKPLYFRGGFLNSLKRKLNSISISKQIHCLWYINSLGSD